MIQFNIKRFGKLACLSLANDKRYFIKSFLQIFVVLLLLFLFMTMMANQNEIPGYRVCSLAVVMMFAVTIPIGPSFMFYSMENKHDMQNLLMLPASNFEKYLMRYATWIILLPIYLVAFFAADLLQYVLHWVMVFNGYNSGEFVCTAVVEMISKLYHQVPAEVRHIGVNYVLITVSWLHSFFALGATFFRTRKYNWVYTSIVIVLLFVLMVFISDDGGDATYKTPTTSELIMADVVTGIWVALNFCLSYILFCRRQVIGKFVNI